MSKSHEALKEIAIKILTEMGYLPNEIYKEYWVQPHDMFRRQNNSLHGCRVDVVGLRKDKRVAIECGKTPGEKIAALKMFFDEVIVLPYFSLNVDKTDLERVLREKNETILKQEARIRELEQKYYAIQNEHSFLDRTLQEITKAWMEMIHRITQHNAYFYYDYSNKTQTEIMNELTTKVNELKEMIRSKEQRERIQRGWDKTQLATLPPIPLGSL